MTTSVGVSPGPVTTAPAVRSTWWRSRLDGATTPARLRLLLALLILLSLAWGALGARAADQPGPPALPARHHRGGHQDRGGQRAGRVVCRPGPAARSPGQRDLGGRHRHRR